MPHSLLASDEPPAVTELRRDGRSDFVILVDHASRRLPKSLGGLGLPDSELTRHIAWDIGALAVAEAVSAALDAPMVAQNYSRLAIDCNRDPVTEGSIPIVSEVTPIAGNQGISAMARQARIDEIFLPYHHHIKQLLDERDRQGRKTILIAQHTMTDCFKGQQREMQMAVMYNRDGRFAAPLREALGTGGLTVADNQPYAMTDATDFTLPTHGEKRGLMHVGIEIRQDLVCDEAGVLLWAGRVAEALEKTKRGF
jgi:predicted N-formylglutamate amidohydrolase